MKNKLFKFYSQTEPECSTELLLLQCATQGTLIAATEFG